jgi:hypothetical protein
VAHEFSVVLLDVASGENLLPAQHPRPFHHAIGAQPERTGRVARSDAEFVRLCGPHEVLKGSRDVCSRESSALTTRTSRGKRATTIPIPAATTLRTHP